jgi:hypothetical protein
LLFLLKVSLNGYASTPRYIALDNFSLYKKEQQDENWIIEEFNIGSKVLGEMILLPEVISRCHYKDTRANIGSTNNHVTTKPEGDGSYICALFGGGVKHKGCSCSP